MWDMFLGGIISGALMSPPRLSTTLTTGYRVDNLKWNIAGDINGQNPNILSELQWTNLQIYQASADINVITSNVYIDGNFAFGEIIAGDNQDSDYRLNNRNFEFSRSNNAAGGDTYDFSMAIGYKLKFTGLGNGGDYLLPMLGYAMHRQNLQMTDAVQTVATAGVTPPLGPFSGLNSSYDAKWESAWVGLAVGTQRAALGIVLELQMNVKYHFADYYAKADWNLRDDFAHPVSYEHQTTGNGMTFSFDVRTAFGNLDHWLLVASLDYGWWHADAGLDRTFLADDTTAVTRLNEVNWESAAVNLGLEYRFE